MKKSTSYNLSTAVALFAFTASNVLAGDLQVSVIGGVAPSASLTGSNKVSAGVYLTDSSSIAAGSVTSGVSTGDSTFSVPGFIGLGAKYYTSIGYNFDLGVNFDVSYLRLQDKYTNTVTETTGTSRMNSAWINFGPVLRYKESSGIFQDLNPYVGAYFSTMLGTSSATGGTEAGGVLNFNPTSGKNFAWGVGYTVEGGLAYTINNVVLGVSYKFTHLPKGGVRNTYNEVTSDAASGIVTTNNINATDITKFMMHSVQFSVGYNFNI